MGRYFITFETARIFCFFKKMKKIPFEFYEFFHLISYGSVGFLIKLWLVGNKKIQSKLSQYTSLIVIYKFPNDETVLMKFLKFIFSNFINVENLQFILPIYSKMIEFSQNFHKIFTISFSLVSIKIKI